MSDGPAVSQQAPSAVDRGEAPATPLGPTTIELISLMSATILAGSVALVRAELSPEDAAALAVRLAVGVANEVRAYRLVDNKAVKKEQTNVS